MELLKFTVILSNGEVPMGPWGMSDSAKDARVFMFQHSSNIGAVHWLAQKEKHQDDWLQGFFIIAPPFTYFSAPGKKGLSSLPAFYCCWKGLDPVECIRQVSPSAISSTVIRWVSKPLQNIIHVALALLGAPVFLGLGQEKTDTTTTLCFVTQDCFPKSMDPSQRTPLSQNVTKSLRNNVLPIVWISLFSL